MNFDYYRTFYYVGKFKSVTLASKELFTSQPAVTRTIKNLEHELGCRLFSRSKKGMELTRDGEILFGYVSASFNQLEKGELEIRKHTSSKEGHITIGATVTALDEFLFSFVKQFSQSYPNIKFKILSESTNKTIGKLRNGLIDVALITTPHQSFDDVEFYKIMEFKNILIAGNNFRYLADKEISLKSINDYPFVAMEEKTQLREYTNRLFLENSLLINPSIEVDSAGLLIPFVRNNLGLSIVPYSLAKNSIERGDLISLNVMENIPNRDVCLVTSKVLPLSNATRTFIKEIKNLAKK